MVVLVSELILDASAVLALLRQERGAKAVEEALLNGIISSVNLSEVMARELEAGVPLEMIDFQLGRLSIPVIPFDEPLAKIAASIKVKTRPFGLSFPDRACLALAMDRKLPVLTGDRDWLKADLALDIKLFR
jgi:ribonuclease VapC